MNQARTERQTWLALGGIVLLALLLRIVFAALPRVVRWDETAYQLIAQSLLAGRGYFELVGARDLQQPPMVAYLTLFGFSAGLPIPWATAGPVQVVLGGLLTLPVYGLGHGLYGRRIGLIAALLVAIYPTLMVSPLYWGTMTEPPYLLYVMCGLYATWRATRTGSWKWAALLGLAFGLAYLTRPEALAYLAVMSAYLVGGRVWDAWQKGSGAEGAAPASFGYVPAKPAGTPLRMLPLSATFGISPATRRPLRAGFGHTLLLALTASVVFMLCALPYVVYIYRVTGRWTFSGKQGISIPIAWAFVNHDQAAHDRTVASLDPSGQEILWLSPNQYDLSLTGWIAENPRRFAWQVQRNLADTWQALFNQDLFSPWMVALICLGLFTRSWSRRRVRDELLLLLALAPLATLWAFFVLSRFLAIVIPIGLLWAAAGLDHLAHWSEATARALCKDPGPDSYLTRRPMVLVRAIPFVAVAAAMLWTACTLADVELPRQPFWRLDIAQWLSANVPLGSPVMVRSTEVALYSQRPAVAFPNAEWAQVLAYAHHRGARYLVVDENELRSVRPQQADLLESAKSRPLPGVKLIEQRAFRNHATLIFTFTDSP